jgi:hypothetical protein
MAIKKVIYFDYSLYNYHYFLFIRDLCNTVPFKYDKNHSYLTWIIIKNTFEQVRLIPKILKNVSSGYPPSEDNLCLMTWPTPVLRIYPVRLEGVVAKSSLKIYDFFYQSHFFRTIKNAFNKSLLPVYTSSLHVN